jgi:ferric-dicitrate binding protein FerR (iron transport regulator)
MTEPRYARLMAKVLQRIAGEVKAPTPAQDARGILEIERALMAARRRRQLTVFGAGGASVAAAAAAAAWVLFIEQKPLEPSAQANSAQANAALGQVVNVLAHANGAGVQLRVAGHEQPLTEDAALNPGAAIISGPNSQATLNLSTGTRLMLATRTQFAVEQANAMQRFQLATGSLHAKVAKLGKSQRFVVATPDAEIEVRGTEFDLSVLDHPGQGCEGSHTLLRVSEGVVEVRAAGGVQRIAAGQRWPANCDLDNLTPNNAASTAAVPTQERLRRGGVLRPAPAEPTQSAGGPQPATDEAATGEAAARNSHLLEQNDLFASGVAARRAGNTQAALSAYGDLLARFPNSPLAENAMVERMRLLKKSDPAQAALEAQRYLSRFPNGFAHNEASAILREHEAKQGGQ